MYTHTHCGILCAVQPVTIINMQGSKKVVFINLMEINSLCGTNTQDQHHHTCARPLQVYHSVSCLFLYLLAGRAMPEKLLYIIMLLTGGLNYFGYKITREA